MSNVRSAQQNFLLICVDCLRSDAVTDGWGRTPFLDSLCADGRVYTNLFATATTTTPCVASLMTGLYSEHNGVMSLRDAQLAPGVETLAERFQGAGYDTCAMVTGPLVEETDLDRGFDTYHYRDKDESLFGPFGRTAVEHLESLDEPFFCYLHLWELHEPISVPERYDDEAFGRWPYERALSALDASLESFVDRLPDDTIIALQGDHGESITWRGNPLHSRVKMLRDTLRYECGFDTRRAERAVNRFVDRIVPSDVYDHFIEAGHGETVYDTTANVPLVLWGPGIEPGRETGVCRQVDVLPTVCALFNLSVDEFTLDGDSLLDGVGDRLAYIRACGASLRGRENWHRAIRTADELYIEYLYRDWPPELYDLTGESPEHAVVEATDERYRLLRQQMPRFDDVVDSERLHIDDRLRDLGYL